MSTKHTRGPWAVNWAGSGKNGQLVYDEVYVYSPACGVEDVAVAAEIVDPLTGKPSVENARLISAAPDLYEALRWMVERADEGGYPDGKCLASARDALAKAHGESNE